MFLKLLLLEVVNSSVGGGVATSPSANGTAAVATGDAIGRDDVADIPGVHGVPVTGAGNVADATGFYPGGVHNAVPGAAASGGAHGHGLSSGGGGVNLDFSPGGGASPQGHGIYLSAEMDPVFPNHPATPVLPPAAHCPCSPCCWQWIFSSQFIFPRPPCCPGSTCHSSPCCWWWNFSSRPSVSKPS